MFRLEKTIFLLLISVVLVTKSENQLDRTKHGTTHNKGLLEMIELSPMFRLKKIDNSGTFKLVKSVQQQNIRDIKDTTTNPKTNPNKVVSEARRQGHWDKISSPTFRFVKINKNGTLKLKNNKGKKTKLPSGTNPGLRVNKKTPVGNSGNPNPTTICSKQNQRTELNAILFLIFLGVPTERLYLGEVTIPVLFISIIGVVCTIAITMLMFHWCSKDGINNQWSPHFCMRNYYLAFNICVYVVLIATLCMYSMLASDDFFRILGHKKLDASGCELQHLFHF